MSQPPIEKTNPSPTKTLNFNTEPINNLDVIDNSIQILNETKPPAPSKPIKIIKPVPDTQIPANIDFGIDKLVNQDVFEIVSGDEPEADVKGFFQTKTKKPIKPIHLKLNYDKQKTNEKIALIEPPKEIVVKNKEKEIKHDNDDIEDENDLDDIENEEDFEDAENGEDDEGDEADDDNEDDEADDDEADDNEDNEADDDDEDDDNEDDDVSIVNNKRNQRGNIMEDIISDSENTSQIQDTRKLTRHELNIRKRKELTLLERLDKKGYKPCKKFTMVDKLDEIVAERERLDDDKGCDESIKWQRKMIMGASTGIEYLNKIYDPFDLKLDGWSESIYENISDYDEVFEELYHKYKTKVHVAPEIKLIGMFAGSALMFHFSKTLFSKASDQVPGFDDVMRNNPDIKTAYEQAALKQMANNQPSNQMGSMIGNFLGNPMLGNMVGGLFNNPNGTSKNPNIPQQHQQHQQHQPSNRSTVDISSPTGVDDLLDSLTHGTNTKLTEAQLTDNELSDIGTLSDIDSNVKSLPIPSKKTTNSTSQKKNVKLNLQ